MTNLDSILKSRDITLSTKVHLVKAMVFPGVIYGFENWTIRDQFKEIEKNSRIGKTRELFKKIGDIKGTFHTRIGTVKDRMSRT